MHGTLSFFTPRILDDSGHAVPLWWPLGLHRNAVPHQLSKRIVYTWHDHASDSVAAFGTALALAYLSVLVSVGPTHPTWPWAIPSLVLVSAFLWLHIRLSWHEFAGPVRTTLLGAARCASCGYDLRGTPVGADTHLTTCPECRAAWRLPGGAGYRPLGIGDAPQPRRTVLGGMLDRAPLPIVIPLGAFAYLDARGRAVALVHPRPARRPPGCWPQLPARESWTLEQKLATLSYGGTALTVAFVIVLIAICYYIFAPAPSLTVTVAFIAILLLPAIPLMRGLYGPSPKIRMQVVQLLLTNNRCASCAGHLSDSTPDAEGITDCPHCRAAWQLPARLAAPPAARRDPRRTIVYNPPRD